MTDPTFDTLEALEAWAEANWQYTIHLPFDTIKNHTIFDAFRNQIARVRAAHSHLSKGTNDAK